MLDEIELHEFICKIRDEIDSRLLGFEVSPSYTIYPDGEIEVYCKNCYEKKEDELNVPEDELCIGSWTETEGHLFCMECGGAIEYILINPYEIIEEEISNILYLDWNTGYTCYSFDRIIGSLLGSGWFDLSQLDKNTIDRLMLLLYNTPNCPECFVGEFKKYHE